MDNIAFLSITDVAGLMLAGKLSPVELTRGCLERIEALDAKLNAFITVTGELALSQAQAAEQELARGEYRGLLHGVPIALKDLYATAGIRTTAHSRLLQDWLPEEDATAVRRLRDAGAVLLGKLALNEFAFPLPSLDSPFPPARNPWDLERGPGGSSSGSGAALAAGLCYGSLGSDTGGSIRNPAALCGVVGLKPTYGRVSRHGVIPLCWSLDHAGPMARSVQDCALLLETLAGYDPRDAASSREALRDLLAGLQEGVRGMRLGVARDWITEGDGPDAEVLAAFDEALKVLEGLGARIVSVNGRPLIEARGPSAVIFGSESHAYHEANLRERPGLLGSQVRARLLQGAFFSTADYIQAQRARSVIATQLREIMRDVDALLSPSSPRLAVPFSEMVLDAGGRLPNLTGPFNLTGLPAISVPMGFSATGLPVGLQVAGHAFDEATVLRIAHAYEQATPWHERHPAL